MVDFEETSIRSSCLFVTLTPSFWWFYFCLNSDMNITVTTVIFISFVNKYRYTYISLLPIQLHRQTWYFLMLHPTLRHLSHSTIFFCFQIKETLNLRKKQVLKVIQTYKAGRIIFAVNITLKGGTISYPLVFSWWNTAKSVNMINAINVPLGKFYSLFW